MTATTIAEDDGPLPVARKRLADAVYAIADPQPQWVGGVLRWSDSVYTRLRVELAGGRLARRQQAHQSRLPCHTGILTLLCEIDATTGAWVPDGKGGTVDRLRQLVDRGWRPQDVATIESYVTQIKTWVVAAAELLNDAPVKVFLREPCPRCGSRTVYRRDGAGEQVRGPALRVSESGATCACCSAHWPPERFHFLAALLGCDPLPA